MITDNQTKNLADIFQIDKFTILREYLQLLFLSYLYQEREAGKIYFKGGTALRLLFGSPRFSEDLDFSTMYSDKEIEKLLNKLEKKLVKEAPRLKISRLYSGKEGIRFRVSFSPPELKYPLNIRLDFHRIHGLGDSNISTLTTRFPVLIFPQIYHLSGAEIFKEKIEALTTRSKGRDIFDIWFLLSKGVEMPKGVKRKKVIDKLESFPQSSIEKDLGKFLPKAQKGIIASLKRELINTFASR
jgi:predicted nucleotidyltransferase component of viral defense system